MDNDILSFIYRETQTDEKIDLQIRKLEGIICSGIEI